MKFTRWTAHRAPIALALTALLLVAACSGGSTTPTGSGGKPVTGGTASVAINTAPDSLNPGESLLVVSSQVFSQIFGTLLQTTPGSDTPAPYLAKAYEYDSATKKLTFHLDPEAAFSTGAPVTSADVKFSAEQWKASALYGAYFSSIESVQAPDPLTVVFVLSEADVTLPSVLASTVAAIYPRDFGGAAAADYWKRPVGAGPFQIKDEVKGQSLDLVRNEHFYRAGRPYLDGLRYKVIPDENQQLLQFQAGDVDLVNNVPMAMETQYAADATVSTPAAGVSVLVSQIGSGPMADADLRRAVSLAIDHHDLVAGGYGAGATQPKTLLPQAIPNVAPCTGCVWGETDLDAAKALVEASGYDGQKIELLVAGDTGPEKLAAEAVKPMLEAAGLTVDIAALPSSSVLDKVGKGDFQMAMYSYFATSPTAIDPLGFIAATGYLFSTADPTVAVTSIGAVHAASTAADVAKAVSAFEADAFATKAAIPLAVPAAIFAVSGRLHGFEATPYSVYPATDLWIRN